MRVKLKRGGKVVKRNGKPVYIKVRRCKKVPSPGCRFVKVKKRTKSGKVVKRNGKPVYIKVERCPPKPKPPAPGPPPGPGPGPGPGPTPGPVPGPGPGPTPGPVPGPGPGPTPGPVPGPGPQPGPADVLANRVLALAQHQPGNINLFTSKFPNGAIGIYPSGSEMAQAGGQEPTADEVRMQLTTYLTRWFGGDDGPHQRCARPLR